MEKLPTHLEKVLKVTEYNENGSISGKIVCECGCDKFGIKYFGEDLDEEPRGIGFKGVGNKCGQIVKAVCRDCKKDHLLFDYAKHGWDGLIGGEGISVPDEELSDLSIENESDFEVNMLIGFDDEIQFTGDVVDDPPEGMSFTPDDRINVWTKVVINLKGAKSGKEFEGFVYSDLV